MTNKSIGVTPWRRTVGRGLNVCGETCQTDECEIGGTKVHCLLDNGSNISPVKKSILDAIVNDWQNVLPRQNRGGKLVGITGDERGTIGCFEVPFTLGGLEIRPARFVCTNRLMLPVAGIFGQDVLRVRTSICSSARVFCTSANQG